MTCCQLYILLKISLASYCSKIVPVVKNHTVHIQLHLISLCHVVYFACCNIWDHVFFQVSAFCFVFLFWVHERLNFLTAIRQDQQHMSNTVKRIPHTPLWHHHDVNTSDGFAFFIQFCTHSCQDFAGHNKYIFIQNTVARVLAADKWAIHSHIVTNQYIAYTWVTSDC